MPHPSISSENILLVSGRGKKAIGSLEVTFVSHACLRLEGEFGTLVCDPWILNEPVYNFTTWKFPAAVLDAEEVTRDVDYLLLTHSHEDHFHVPSLDRFSRDVQVLLPEYSDHPSLRAQTIERTLRLMGFSKIRKFRPWERYFLGGKTPLTFLPAAVSRDHDWENCAFVVEAPGCTLINLNDNLTDLDLCQKIRGRFPHIDLALVQTAGVTMYPGCFKFTPEEMTREARKRVHGFAEQRRVLDGLRPKRIAPIAGDFCWLDPKFFHNNWANRATPKIFSEMVARDYHGREPEIIEFLPGDTWSAERGHVRRHPEVDWDNYLDEIAGLQLRFRPKVERLRRWIDGSSRLALRERTWERTALVEKWITRDYLFFEARFRIAVEGPHSGFAFVLAADLEQGFRILWDDEGPVDQTLHVEEGVWAAVLEGKLMWNILQWSAIAEQHVPYRLDMGRFWFWLEYHVDLNNKVPQVMLEPLLYGVDAPLVRSRFGVFENEE